MLVKARIPLNESKNWVSNFAGVYNHEFSVHFNKSLSEDFNFRKANLDVKFYFDNSAVLNFYGNGRGFFVLHFHFIRNRQNRLTFVYAQ